MPEFAPSIPPSSERRTNDRRIKSETPSDICEDSEPSRNREISKSSAQSATAEMSEQGKTVRARRALIKPQSKNEMTLAASDRGKIRVSGSFARNAARVKISDSASIQIPPTAVP